MSKENIGYYESNIQTSRNVENIKDARIDGVIAIKLWSLTKQVDNLIKENQELKEQLKIKHDGFMASIEEKCELAEENQKLKEKIKNIVTYAYGTDMLVSEYEQLRKIAEVE